MQLDLLDLAFLHLIKRQIDLKGLLRTPHLSLHKQKQDLLAPDADDFLQYAIGTLVKVDGDLATFQELLFSSD